MIRTRMTVNPDCNRDWNNVWPMFHSHSQRLALCRHDDVSSCEGACPQMSSAERITWSASILLPIGCPRGIQRGRTLWTPWFMGLPRFLNNLFYFLRPLVGGGDGIGTRLSEVAIFGKVGLFAWKLKFLAITLSLFISCIIFMELAQKLY